MKKIIISIVMVASLLLLVTGCEKKEKTKEKPQETGMSTAELFDEKMGINTKFSYNATDNFTEFEKEDGGASKSMTFKNEDLDVKFEMYYNVMTKTSYDKSQETRSAQKYYKEYKFGEYAAYVYGEYDDGLYLNILANVDNFDNASVLFVSIDRIDNNKEVIVSDVFAENTIQDFFNSMKVEMRN